MSNVLMIVAHPYWPQSFANKAIVDEFRSLRPDAEVRNLFELYPDNSNIDVAAEQQALERADIVILQFPIMWYSCPSNLHRWMEEVLTYGFAYGPGGEHLKGKTLLLSFTSAGTPDKYSAYGAQGCTIDQLMTPFSATAVLCGLHFGSYTYSGGMLLFPGAPAAVSSLITATAQAHAARLAAKL